MERHQVRMFNMLAMFVISFAFTLGTAGSLFADDTLRVGVRSDAAPFAYHPQNTDSENLDEYRGYVVEVCKEVLADMARLEPFKGVAVEAVKVTAKTRFDELLSNGAIDILCGPASITADRVERHMVSQPIYLTGVSLAHPKVGETASTSPFPFGSVCDRSLIGFVTNTTAEYPGLQKIVSERRIFGRFNDAIEILMRMSPEAANSGYSLEVYMSLVGTQAAAEFSSVCDSIWRAPPIRAFNDHQEGLSALCEGSVLYYVADVDIISDYLLRNAEKCGDITLNRDVVNIEHYGIYFGDGSLEGDRGLARSLQIYAAFSHSLTRRLYHDESVFERAYQSAFEGRPRTSSLNNFFRSFRTGSNN